MTKRFTYQQIYDGISEHEQFYDNHKRMRYDEVCDKLNEQDKRITELEEENQKMRELLFDPHRITNGVDTDD